MSRKRWLPLSLLLAGMGTAGVAALAGSIGFVRFAASGHLYAESDVPAAPVALVLGAKVNPDGTPSAFLAARLDLAKRLYDVGRVEVIIVSGNDVAPEFDEPVAMRDYLVRAGVPAEKVITDPKGFDTYQSCVRVRQIVSSARLIVVTQSYHLPRAVATCRAIGLAAVGVGDDSARQYRVSWLQGAIRDQLACVKTVVDLAKSRYPTTDNRPANESPERAPK